MRYKAIVFDFDGTLADSFAWFLFVMDDVADRYRFKRLDRDNLETLRGLSGRQLMRRHGVPLWKVPLITRHMRVLMARDIDQIPLFDGVDDMLARLAAQGVTLAVVTSNAETNVRRVLGPRNAALIRHYECGASVFGKPDKLRKVLRKAGVAPGEAIVIGDEIRDIEAGKVVGMATGAVAWGYTALPALVARMPTRVFERIDDITVSAV
ncbi:HAD hydrolase-like protein [Chelatococcus sp. SYSU_G07232]|uniref:HAD hydrolase-like protein n=1 Tax=Chelatococcus albus TaxID=3047466 RepID=A0ABT7AL69_9HYPH|nr:HAD hydrolase-like protein [Chelatococcus sp. SYSU_G07232]MDJ1159712.1 HAD hydrolase-like protein [Chelatococcus sp. SYSU_G07232]